MRGSQEHSSILSPTSQLRHSQEGNATNVTTQTRGEVYCNSHLVTRQKFWGFIAPGCHKERLKIPKASQSVHCCQMRRTVLFDQFCLAMAKNIPSVPRRHVVDWAWLYFQINKARLFVVENLESICRVIITEIWSPPNQLSYRIHMFRTIHVPFSLHEAYEENMTSDVFWGYENHFQLTYFRVTKWAIFNCAQTSSRIPKAWRIIIRARLINIRTKLWMLPWWLLDINAQDVEALHRRKLLAKLILTIFFP